MTDEELQIFAINESDKLTMESFHLLKDEFGKRNLDLSIIEYAETDKSLAELEMQSTFKNAVAHEFTNSVWQFAFDEKELGKTNFEIYNSLLHKGVDQKYAFMLIQSLDIKSKKLEESYNDETIVGWIILGAGVLTMYLSFNSTLSGIFGLYGFLITGGGAFRIYKNTQQKEKYQKISKNIEIEKDNLKQN